MSLITALFLGLIQGLTEFFPISSSAHLEIAKKLFGIGSTPVLFDLACHLGTLIALLWFFRTDIITILRSDKKKGLYLTLALIPLLPSYFLLSHLRAYLASPHYLGLLLMATGGIILAGQRIRVKKRGGMLRDILLIGTMQSCALIPGISRSASTISCAQILGWSQQEAVRFSFLLAIPTIMSGTFFEIRKLAGDEQLLSSIGPGCLVGFAAAAVAGFAIINLAIRILERGKLANFAWYCLILGGLTQLTITLIS